MRCRGHAHPVQAARQSSQNLHGVTAHYQAHGRAKPGVRADNCGERSSFSRLSLKEVSNSYYLLIPGASLYVKHLMYAISLSPN